MNIDLITRLQRGDVAALEEVHRTYRNRVFAHAMNVLRDPWDAEEVLQDVMWTAFRKAGTLASPEAFDTWLFRVTRNSCLMLLRKRRRVPAPMEEEVITALTDEHSHNPYQPDRMYARREALSLAQVAVESLHPTSRRIYVEMEVEGRAKEDVAGDLGISISALKARLHRARTDVREAFAERLAA